jgi:oligoribonuclease NrnB/cAMP/cGMP phosphodiesterase (DHH superfamily)
MPIQYGEPAPNVAGRDVLMFDFSFDRETLLRLKDQAASFEVYDHHKTAEAALKDIPGCHFDMNKSGATLAWDYFEPGKKAPALVHYVEDRDLWRWALPNSREINAAIASFPLTMEAWDELASTNVVQLELEGRAVLRYKQRMVDWIVKGAVEQEMDGHKILVANVSYVNVLSEVGEALDKDRPFSACYYWCGGKKFWSLRSDPNGLDVSAIAKAHGGGGHARAAGFVEG